MILGFPLTLLLLLILFLFYAIDFYYLLRFDRERGQGKGWAWDYTLLTIAAALVVILQPWLLPWLGLTLDSILGLAVQIAGTLFCAASFALHIWSRRHLQKFYAERVEIQFDHQIVRTGPYAYVRHPVITSFFLLAFGLFLLSPAITTFAGLIYIVWDFTRAARQEEELLGRKLPGYADYMKSVPRFFSFRKGGR